MFKVTGLEHAAHTRRPMGLTFTLFFFSLSRGSRERDNRAGHKPGSGSDQLSRSLYPGPTSSLYPSRQAAQARGPGVARGSRGGGSGSGDPAA